MHTYNQDLKWVKHGLKSPRHNCGPWWAGTFVGVAMVWDLGCLLGEPEAAQGTLRALWWLQWQVDDSITGTDRDGKASRKWRGEHWGKWKKLTVQSSRIPSWMATKRGPKLPITEKELTHFSISQSLIGGMVHAFPFSANGKQNILRNWPKPRHQISFYVFRLRSF